MFSAPSRWVATERGGEASASMCGRVALTLSTLKRQTGVLRLCIRATRWLAKRCRVHRIPPRVRDDGQRPSCGVGWREFVEMICPTGEAKYFCKRGWTPLSTNRPTGKSVDCGENTFPGHGCGAAASARSHEPRRAAPAA